MADVEDRKVFTNFDEFYIYFIETQKGFLGNLKKKTASKKAVDFESIIQRVWVICLEKWETHIAHALNQIAYVKEIFRNEVNQAWRNHYNSQDVIKLEENTATENILDLKAQTEYLAEVSEKMIKAKKHFSLEDWEFIELAFLEKLPTEQLIFGNDKIAFDLLSQEIEESEKINDKVLIAKLSSEKDKILAKIRQKKCRLGKEFIKIWTQK